MRRRASKLTRSGSSWAGRPRSRASSGTVASRTVVATHQIRTRAEQRERRTPCSMSACVFPGGKNACLRFAGGGVACSGHTVRGCTTSRAVQGRTMSSLQSSSAFLLCPSSDSFVNAVWKLDDMRAWSTTSRQHCAHRASIAHAQAFACHSHAVVVSRAKSLSDRRRNSPGSGVVSSPATRVSRRR